MGDGDKAKKAATDDGQEPAETQDDTEAAAEAPAQEDDAAVAAATEEADAAAAAEEKAREKERKAQEKEARKKAAAEKKAAKEQAEAEKKAAKEQAAAEKRARKEAQKRAKLQKSLRLSDETARQLLTGFSIGIAFHDVVTEEETGALTDYRVLETNPAFEALTESTVGDLVGSLASEIYGKNKAPYLDVIGAALESGEERSFEGRLALTRTRLLITVKPMAEGLFALLVKDGSKVGQRRRRRTYLETRVKNLTAERNDARSALADATAANKALNKEKAGLEKKLTTSEQKESSLDADLEKANAAVATLKARVAELEPQLAAAEKTRKQLEKRIAAADDARDKLQNAMKELAGAVKSG